MGKGGSPEGVMTACAITSVCGFIEGRLAPSDDAERARGEAAGLRFDTVLTADDLVSGDNTMFTATRVTDGGLVEGVRLLGDTIRTVPVVLRSEISNSDGTACETEAPVGTRIPMLTPPAFTGTSSGASAISRDGTLSYSATCSGHGGVRTWL